MLPAARIFRPWQACSARSCSPISSSAARRIELAISGIGAIGLARQIHDCEIEGLHPDFHRCSRPVPHSVIDSALPPLA